MKESRKLLYKAGQPLFRIVIAFSVLKELIIIPLMSFIWKWILVTTPDGFISNANIGKTLLKSPWVIIVGAVLLLSFLVFSMWQISATVFGVAYAYEGKRTKVLDLLRISLRKVADDVRLANWKILLYTAIILPITNIFQASEMIGAFVVPEYIHDFIYSKATLLIIYWALIVVAAYFALRWFYVLPSFFLKGNDFDCASKESFAFTKKGAIKNVIKFAIYSLIETMRLVVLPFVIIVVTCGLVCICLWKVPNSYEIFTFVSVRMANNLCAWIYGVMVYLSSMCFVVNGYYKKCLADDSVQDIKLPELSGEPKHYRTGRYVQVTAVLFGAIVSICIYLILLLAAQVNPELLEKMAYSPNVVAHKGYSSKAPENTMDAFELADQTPNADYIELDVWSTKDGIPVVIHNETITAATGREGYIYDYTYDELKDIPAPYSMEQISFPDARIPKLEEVIQTYSSTTPLIIEIKGYKADDQLPAKIVALMEKYDCTENSMIHSGDYAALKAVKLCNPSIKCGLIQAIVTGNCYDLPYADFLSVEHSFVTKQMVTQLHNRGKELYVWTVNYEESIDSLKSVDVDGFITDYPDDIAATVKEERNFINSILGNVPDENLDVETAKEEFAEGDY